MRPGDHPVVPSTNRVNDRFALCVAGQCQAKRVIRRFCEMDFDLVQSLIGAVPRSFFQASHAGIGNARHTALCRCNQTECAAAYAFATCQEEDVFGLWSRVEILQ
jgi:hypothetical protein